MISFVVQGPTNHVNSVPFTVNIGNQASIHPNEKLTTQSCIDSLRKFYPGCEIIVSCTTGDADTLTGVDKTIYITDDMLEFENNVNRQILSSQAVKHAKNDIVCKIRSDMIALTDGLLPYIKSRIEYKRLDSHKMFDEYVVICNWTTEKTHYYHPSDFMFLGTKKDIVSIFDIPQRTDLKWKVGPEQYINLRCMENYNLQKYIDYEWLEANGSWNTHLGSAVPPKDSYVENWWKVFYSNYYVLDLGASAGLVSTKYLDRVFAHPNLVNHKEWKNGHERYIK